MIRVIKKQGLTLLEILIASVIGVILLGIVYLAYNNISALQKVQALEGEFKQESNTAMQDMIFNIQNSFQTTASFYYNTGTITGFYGVGPAVSKVIYDPNTTSTTHDTIGVFSSEKSKYEASTLYKGYIRYGLKKIPGAPNNFKGYALYKQIQENLVDNNGPSAIDPNASTCKTMIGYYRNRNNYLAVSKLDFDLRGTDTVTIHMQLVGAKSRGSGTTTKAIYKPSSTTFYKTSVQIKLDNGQLSN